MISFKELNSENAAAICNSLSTGLGEDAASFLCEMINGIDTEDCDLEYAVSVFESCLLVRIFDMGRYLFVFPCELDDGADVKSAISAVGEYAAREEIPIVFVDVPGELLSLFSGYRHLDIDADDPSAEVYRVRIKTECELLDEIPHIEWGRVKLDALSENDIASYARLSKDENVNKYWGYNYLEDISAPGDGYFFENAALEFSRGVAMTMAIRTSGDFIGEATLYAFDGKGGAEFAIRLLSERQGCGLGTEAVLALAEAARNIGLLRLHAKVMKENSSSIAMLKKVSDEYFEEDGCIYFTLEL